MDDHKNWRRLPIGAELMRTGGVHFRLWSDHRKKVELVLESGTNLSRNGNPVSSEMQHEGNGYFSLPVFEAGEGTLYRFRLDGGDELFPDPASRFQPQGPHGPSCVIDPERFTWTDSEWQGVTLKGQVIYEMHIGTFTREGTFRAAATELTELASAGITTLELMPVGDFSGRYGWGYDGVDIFAPTRLYGKPDDFRYFVDSAHAAGVGVILDVIYNHFGPDGNFLNRFSNAYSTDRYSTPWGQAINFDGPGAAPVREFYIANARYWIEEFHLDGLRFDSAENIFDSSPEHILIEITRQVRQAAAGRRAILIAENESQEVRFVDNVDQGGYGMDALWNDDFHHSAVVAMTGRNEAYYTDYCGNPQEFVSALKRGYLYQGQYYKWQEKARGTSALHLDPARFVVFIQNHDQIANSGRGDRVHKLTSPGLYRAMTALMLLSPCTPMLFQGQEFAASTPFLYFADLPPDLSKKVREGRLAFLSQFPSLADEAMKERIADFSDPSTFERSKLDLSERIRHAEAYALHKDLLKLRREDPVLSAQKPGALDGAVLSDKAFVLRFFGRAGEDRLLVVNLGVDMDVVPAPEPLLSPPAGMQWEILWNSENVRYGGLGTPIFNLERNWKIPGHTTIVLRPQKRQQDAQGVKEK